MSSCQCKLSIYAICHSTSPILSFPLSLLSTPNENYMNVHYVHVGHICAHVNRMVYQCRLYDVHEMYI